MTAAEKMICFFIIPMLTLILAIVLVFIYVSYDAAWLLSFFGTPAIMFANIAYIIFLDSKKRWPALTARQRAVKVLTFQR